MKRTFVAVLLALGVVQAGLATELGVRFGNHMGGHVAIDGIFSVGDMERVHADVSFGHGIVGVEALWDFMGDRMGSSEFDWYLGAGPAVYFGDGFGMGVTGELGLEYHFDEPVAIGLDWRPIFMLVEETDLYADRFGLNLRYVF